MGETPHTTNTTVFVLLLGMCAFCRHLVPGSLMRKELELPALSLSLCSPHHPLLCPHPFEGTLTQELGYQQPSSLPVLTLPKKVTAMQTAVSTDHSHKTIRANSDSATLWQTLGKGLTFPHPALPSIKWELS